MRRIVRAGLIQASVGTGEPKALDRLKQFMIDKHVSLIEQAAAEGVRIIVNGYWDFLGRDGRSLHRRWRLFSVGGTSTLVGNLIGLAVYDAVARRSTLGTGGMGKILGLRGRSERNVGPDHVATLRASKWA